MPSKLSPEDQARVDQILDSSVNRVERKPFRGWLLFWVVIFVMSALGGLSLLLARLEGAI